MTLLLRLCGIALLTAFVALLLKQVRSPIVPLLIGTGLLLLFSAVFSRLQEGMTALRPLIHHETLGVYGELMLKSLGIALIVRFASDFCRDSGAEGLAGTLELAGKAEILFLCLPLFRELITLLEEVFG